MRNKSRLVTALLVVTLCSIFALGSAMALDFGPRYFRVSISGPVSTRASVATVLVVTVKNPSAVDTHVLGSVQAVVIDPFTGTRVVGPITSTQNTTIEPGESTTRQISFTIPVAFRNKTLAAVISAGDDDGTVHGTAGWGFVVQ
jgi:hypothetical protein